MSSPRVVLKKETRVFGAAQIMIGLFHAALGHIWINLYRGESEALLIYLPVTLLTGYPFWGCFFYVISGISAIEAEKMRSPRLLKYTIKMNIHSSALSVIGLLLIITEITLFLMKRVRIQWPVRSGIILSVYLWIFSTVEFFLANAVAKWGRLAFHHDNYPS